MVDVIEVIGLEVKVSNPPQALLRLRTNSNEQERRLEGNSLGRVISVVQLLIRDALRHRLPAGSVVEALRIPPRPESIHVKFVSNGQLREENFSTQELSVWNAFRYAGQAVAVACRELGLDQAAPEANALMSDSNFWNTRYLDADTGWDLGQAAPPLVRAFGSLAHGRAVVVGCGRGHEVRALARMDFEAVGIDFSKEAIDAASKATEAEGLVATFVQADVFTLPGALAPFRYWVEHTCFCAIDPARRAEYVEVAHRSLAEGGQLVGLFYAHGRPGGPPFTTSEDDVKALFGKRFRLDSIERPGDSIERRRGEELLVKFTRLP